MNKFRYLVFAWTVLAIPVGYADSPQSVPAMGNMSVGIPAPANPLPHQDTQSAIMQSNSQGDSTIMQEKAQERMGRQVVPSGMQNGMNSSMGAR